MNIAKILKKLEEIETYQKDARTLLVMAEINSPQDHAARRITWTLQAIASLKRDLNNN